MSEQRTTAGTTLVLPGYLRAWQEAAIYARVKGYLKQWHVDFGASVKAGQLLADIDTPDRDETAAAKAMVETRQTELDFAKSTYERWHRAPIGVVSVQGTLTKQDDFEIAAARLHTAMAEMNVVQGEVDRLRQQLNFKRISSPLDGVLIERNLNIGMPVNDSCGSDRFRSHSRLRRPALRACPRVWADLRRVGQGDAEARRDLRLRPRHAGLARLARSVAPGIPAERQALPAGRDFRGRHRVARAMATIFINLHLRGQLLWNPDIDIEAELADFYVRFYGPAATSMAEYWNAIFAAWEQTIVTEHEYFVAPAIYTPELIEQLQEENGVSKRLCRCFCPNQSTPAFLSHVSPPDPAMRLAIRSRLSTYRVVRNSSFEG